MDGCVFKKILGLCMAVSIIAFYPAQLQAEEEKGFDAKKRAFCKLMLGYGEDAFARGDMEKAGYYFQKAVQADPSLMAKTWFKMKSGGGESEEETAPMVPAGTPPAEGEGGVIMGDDEGC